MPNPFDKYDGQKSENHFDQYDNPQPEKAGGSGGIRRAVADPLLSLVKGAISVPEAAVGLADLVTGGGAGKLANDLGFRPKEAKAALDELLSPEQQAANKKVADAQGFGDTLLESLKNPSTIAHTVLESLPSIGAGGVFGRGVGAVAPKLSALVRGAAGEGAVTAGQQAEQVRQGTEDGYLTPEQAGYSAAAGGLTGLISLGSGRLANKLGIGDIDQLAAGGAMKGVKDKNIIRRTIEGVVTEGAFEELPQSAQEQIMQNLAEGKPWAENVDKAAATGLLAGSLMGGAAAALSRPEKAPEAKAPPPLGLPAPGQTVLTMGGPGSVAGGDTAADDNAAAIYAERQKEELRRAEVDPEYDAMMAGQVNLQNYSKKGVGVALEEAQARAQIASASGFPLTVIPHAQGGYTTMPSPFLSEGQRAGLSKLNAPAAQQAALALPAPTDIPAKATLAVDAAGNAAPMTFEQQAQANEARIAADAISGRVRTMPWDQPHAGPLSRAVAPGIHTGAVDYAVAAGDAASKATTERAMSEQQAAADGDAAMAEKQAQQQSQAERAAAIDKPVKADRTAHADNLDDSANAIYMQANAALRSGDTAKASELTKEASALARQAQQIRDAEMKAQEKKNASSVSAGSQPAVDKPSVPDVAFESPDAAVRGDYERGLVADGVEPTAAKRVAAKQKAPRDVVTGFYNANADDGSGDVQARSIKAAQDYVAKTGKKAFYVSADVVNLGGLNAAMGNVKSKANTHYKAIANLMSEALTGTGAEVVPMRTGGDEIGAVVVGGDKAKVEAAIAEASAKIKEYATANGLDTVANPKRPNEKGVGLHIGSSEILTGQSVTDIVDAADKIVNRSKNNVTGKPGRQNGEVQEGKPGSERAARTGGEQANAGSVRDGRGPSGSAGSLEQPAGQDNRNAPLEGLPSRVKVGFQFIEFGPHLPAREAAEKYAKKAGIPYNPPRKYAKVDKARAKRIALAFDAMKDDPFNPEVRAAYQQAAKEIIAQYEAMLETGLVVEFNPEGQDPYGNPRNAILDVVNNNHLFIFPTDAGYGSDAISKEAEDRNPMLAMTEHKISGRPARVNDLFRAVHDYFGHIKEGVGFRADGEENAWRQHMAMFSPLAQKAVTSETRGQNSWVNFGPYAEANKTASGADTVYADQKIGILPEWVMKNGVDDNPPSLEEKIDEAAAEANRATKAASDKAYAELFAKWDSENRTDLAVAESRAKSGFTEEQKSGKYGERKVKIAAYNAKRDSYRTISVKADDALAALREDINATKALLKCLKG